MIHRRGRGERREENRLERGLASAASALAAVLILVLPWEGIAGAEARLDEQRTEEIAQIARPSVTLPLTSGRDAVSRDQKAGRESIMACGVCANPLMGESRDTAQTRPYLMAVLGPEDFGAITIPMAPPPCPDDRPAPRIL